MVGTLAINTMAPPAALKEVHPAAKMQTFRKVRLAPPPRDSLVHPDPRGWAVGNEPVFIRPSSGMVWQHGGP